MSKEGWELVFMMFVLKLPIVYLVGVVWWAIRATPDPLEPAPLLVPEPELRDPPRRPCSWRPRTRRLLRRSRSGSRGALAGARR